MPTNMIILLVVIGVLLFSLLLVVLSRYRRCPSDKIMVIYGKVGNNGDGTTRSAKWEPTKTGRPGRPGVFTAARRLSGRSFSRLITWI